MKPLNCMLSGWISRNRPRPYPIIFTIHIIILMSSRNMQIKSQFASIDSLNHLGRAGLHLVISSFFAEAIKSRKASRYLSAASVAFCASFTLAILTSRSSHTLGQCSWASYQQNKISKIDFRHKNHDKYCRQKFRDREKNVNSSITLNNIKLKVHVYCSCCVIMQRIEKFNSWCKVWSPSKEWP